MSLRTTAFVLAAAAAAGLTATAASAYPGEKLASEARVSMPQARAKAIAAVPGTIKSSELEREAGGSGLRYSFDIASKAGIREVGIDAKTGAVLENSSDGTPTASTAPGAEAPDAEAPDADGKD